MKKILVVEDDSTIAQGLKELLQSEAYKVYTVVEGNEALRKTVAWGPDLVLLDVNLPGLSGFEVCRQIRAKGYVNPIVMLTSRAEQVDKVIGLEVGADDYVTKPFDGRELLARLRAHLRVLERLPSTTKHRTATTGLRRRQSGDPTVVGSVIDDYEILSVLGKGGMGVVYKANDMTLEREVALKVMNASLSSDASFLKRFQSEAKALAKLQNPNIVTVHALRETELGFCIVMEFVRGCTLADKIHKTGSLDTETALAVFKPVLNALDHAHKSGIIHRDIKPSNILLTDDGGVKVTDFGLAKIQQGAAATVTVGTGGTLCYMSPEQVRGLANVDARGDIYSTGMTLYETLAGRVPFASSETEFSIMQTIVDGKIAPLGQLNPSLPDGLVKAVMKALSHDPEKRYQSAAEMWSALELFQRVADSHRENSPKAAIRQGFVVTRKFMYPVLIIVFVILMGLLLRSLLPL